MFKKSKTPTRTSHPYMVKMYKDDFLSCNNPANYTTIASDIYPDRINILFAEDKLEDAGEFYQKMKVKFSDTTCNWIPFRKIT